MSLNLYSSMLTCVESDLAFEPPLLTAGADVQNKTDFKTGLRAVYMVS